MSFKQPLSMWSSLHKGNHDKLQRQAKNSSKLRHCTVCGDKAYIINYGALSCQSCKTFFRRNGFHPKNVGLCFYNRSCEVNIHTRRKCTGCRLAKCLSVGMSPDFIRKEEQQKRKYIPPPESGISGFWIAEQETSVPQLWPFDLLYEDRPVLVNSEERLLSNIIYAHDLHSALPQVQHIIQSSPPSSPHTHFNVMNALKIIIHSYTSMRSFVNSTPDFRILTVNEQCSLVERNLNGISVLYSVLVFRETGVIHNHHYMRSFTLLYGLDIMQQTIRINKQLDTDSTIIKLMLIVLSFSSNCSIVDYQQETHNDSLLYGTHRLLGSQNVYAELLWKYMVHHYGYYASALRFARLVELSLDLTKYFADMYMNNKTHHSLVDDIIRKTKQLLVVDQNKQVLLWGKI